MSNRVTPAILRVCTTLIMLLRCLVPDTPVSSPNLYSTYYLLPSTTTTPKKQLTPPPPTILSTTCAHYPFDHHCH
jgi:hypothetical protein